MFGSRTRRNRNARIAKQRRMSKTGTPKTVAPFASRTRKNRNERIAKQRRMSGPTRPTAAQRKAASDARRRRTRNTRTPNIDDLLAAAKRASGRTGSGTLEARTKAAKDMNRIKRQMRGMRPSGRPVAQPTGGRRRRPIRGRRR